MADSDSAYKDDVAPEDGSPFRPLYDDRILFSGQPIALVLADDWETARFAASLVRVDYEAEPFNTDLYGRTRVRRSLGARQARDGRAEPHGRPRRVRCRCRAPRGRVFRPDGEPQPDGAVRHRRSLWEGGGKLTVYDKTQGVQNVQRYLCSVFGLPAGGRARDVALHGRRVRLRPAPAVSGGAGRLAARALQRSVRVVLTRQQMYVLGYRPASIERLAIGAQPDGTLDALTHEAIAVTSQYEDFSRNDTGWGGLLYKSPNTRFEHRLVRLDVPTASRHARAGSGDRRLRARMRDGRAGRGAARWTRWSCGCAATRTATRTTDLPYTSKALRECYRQGADSLRLGAGAARSPARCATARSWSAGAWRRASGRRCRCRPRCASRCGQRARRGVLRHLRYRHRHLHDHGAGGGRHAGAAARQRHHQARRLVAAALARGRRLVDRRHGVECASRRRRRTSARTCWTWPRRMPDSPLARRDAGRRHARRRPHRQPARTRAARCRSPTRCATAGWSASSGSGPTPSQDLSKYARNTHSAIFAEVKVDEQLGVIRVTRVVNAVAAGRILNPKTAAQPDQRQRGVRHRHGAARGSADGPQASAAS